MKLLREINLIRLNIQLKKNMNGSRKTNGTQISHTVLLPYANATRVWAVKGSFPSPDFTFTLATSIGQLHAIKYVFDLYSTFLQSLSSPGVLIF